MLSGASREAVSIPSIPRQNGLMVGLGDLSGLFQRELFYDSMSY